MSSFCWQSLLISHWQPSNSPFANTRTLGNATPTPEPAMEVALYQVEPADLCLGMMRSVASESRTAGASSSVTMVAGISFLSRLMQRISQSRLSTKRFRVSGAIIRKQGCACSKPWKEHGRLVDLYKSKLRSILTTLSVLTRGLAQPD